MKLKNTLMNSKSLVIYKNMRNIIYILLVNILISSSLIAQEKYLVTGKSVNVRQSANKYATVIGTVKKSDTSLVQV